MKLTYAVIAAALFATGAAAQDALPELTMNQALHDRLPEDVKERGRLVAVNNGSFPPYEIINGTEMTGASPELRAAVSTLLGIEIGHATVGGLPAMLTGINAGRYDFGFGPDGDFKSRQEANDFIDWAQEFVVFAVKTGNPKGIVSLDTACGQRIAVMAGGSAERVIKSHSQTCIENGKPEITVQSYTDQPSSILSVRSNRADAFFSSQAPLTYFVEQSNGQLELAGVGESNGFIDLYQGAVVPKDSPLGPILLDAMKELVASGHYQAIMTKWGLENNMLLEPGMNMGGTLPQ